MLLLRVVKTTAKQLRCTTTLLFTQRCCSTNQHTKALVSCQQLSSLLHDPNNHTDVRVLDATWGLDGGDYSAEHFKCRIPGSKFFDLEVCRDVDSPYKMMLPSPQQFEEYVSDLGVGSDNHIIIYDNHPKHAMFSAPRLWWMFNVFGHSDVSILNGGLTSWLKLGYVTTHGPYSEDESRTKGDFKATLNEELVRDYNFVQNNSTSSKPVQLLESRGLETLPHSEDGAVDLTSSSVPCAVWTPFNQLLDSDARSVRSVEDIRHSFSSNGVDLSAEPVTTCGRGVSASVVTFCAYYATGNLLPVYDGSWSEWSAKMKE